MPLITSLRLSESPVVSGGPIIWIWFERMQSHRTYIVSVDIYLRPCKTSPGPDHSGRRSAANNSGGIVLACLQQDPSILSDAVSNRNHHRWLENKYVPRWTCAWVFSFVVSHSLNNKMLWLRLWSMLLVLWVAEDDLGRKLVILMRAIKVLLINKFWIKWFFLKKKTLIILMLIAAIEIMVTINPT